jgi:hypothetical protein
MFDRDWDLWGPLLLCLMLGIMLSINVCDTKTIHSESSANCNLGTPQSIPRRVLQCYRYMFVGCSDGNNSSKGLLICCTSDYSTDRVIRVSAFGRPSVRMSSTNSYFHSALTSKQIVFPGPLCSRILYSSPRYRSPHLLLRSHHLCQSTHRVARLGMVYMGLAFSRILLPLISILNGFYSASVNFLDGTKIEQQRILLAVYPLL